MKRYRMHTRLLAVLVVVSASAVGRIAASLDEGANEEAQRQAWRNLKTLAGAWAGTGHGKPGTSRIERHYELILQDQFVMGRNVSRFEPRDGNAKGEVHEDLSVFSFDRGRKTVVLREFHSEGFINRYVLEEISEDGRALTFVTESVENGPPGLRARLALRLSADQTASEHFELAFPGKPFETCVRTTLSRH